MPLQAGTAADITPREVERLTGVGGERLRTWRRRFHFPDGGHESARGRSFAVKDLPAIMAVREMIEAGYSVGEAIGTVQGVQGPLADLPSLTDSFSSLDAPVVVIGGPEPLTVAWSNAAALHDATSGDLLPPRDHALYRVVQRALVQPDGSALATRPSRRAADGEPQRVLLWRIGAPAFTPSVVVVLDLPGEAATAAEEGVAQPEPEQIALRAMTSGVRRARHLLQRGAGGSVLSDALAALVDGAGACDGCVLLAEGDVLRGGMSAHGRMLSPTAGAHVEAAWRSAQDQVTGGAHWLGGAACRELHGAGGRPCLALALAGGGRELGLLIIEFDEAFELGELADELLQGLGAALAGTILRDRAVALRRAQLAA